MIQDLKLQTAQECIALISGITYKNEYSWFGESERPLKMSLLVPKHREGHAPQPLLIWLCGGNFQVMDRDIWLPQLMPYALRGFTVASVEYRTVNEAPFPACLIDVKAAIRYLRAKRDRYCIDPDRVFIMGESAGGALAVFAGLLSGPGYEEYEEGDHPDQSSAVSGVIDLYGPVVFERDYADMKSNPVKHGAYYQRMAAFPGEERERKYARIVPDCVTSAAPPHLILHGTADVKVDISHSEILHDALTRCGVPAQLYRIEGAGHGEDVFYQNEVVEIVTRFILSLV